MKETILKLIFPDNEYTESQESLIDTLLEIQSMKLLSWLPKDTEAVPTVLEHVVVETTIARYNRIGSEGMAKEVVEGHTMEFKSVDIGDFSEDIQRYLDSLDTPISDDRVVRFL